jgi:hypothetical protein
MKYVTRERVKVDRVACPWLISRFVDSMAEFLFVPAADVLEFAEREGAIPFDIPGADLGHHGDQCSFEAIIARHGIEAPGMTRLAEIVRGADTGQLSLTQESAGLLAMAEGFQCLDRDDHELLRLEFPVYDALLAYCAAREQAEDA